MIFNNNSPYRENDLRHNKNRNEFVLLDDTHDEDNSNRASDIALKKPIHFFSLVNNNNKLRLLEISNRINENKIPINEAQLTIEEIKLITPNITYLYFKDCNYTSCFIDSMLATATKIKTLIIEGGEYRFTSLNFISDQIINFEYMYVKGEEANSLQSEHFLKGSQSFRKRGFLPTLCDDGHEEDDDFYDHYNDPNHWKETLSNIGVFKLNKIFKDNGIKHKKMILKGTTFQDLLRYSEHRWLMTNFSSTDQEHLFDIWFDHLRSRKFHLESFKQSLEVFSEAFLIYWKSINPSLLGLNLSGVPFASINELQSSYDFYPILDRTEIRLSLQEYLGRGYPVTIYLLRQLFFSQNFTVINLALQHISKELLEEKSKEIRAIIIFLNNSDLYKSVSQNCPQLFSMCSSDELNESAKRNQITFIEYVLKSDIKLEEEHVLSLIENVQNENKINIIKLLSINHDHFIFYYFHDENSSDVVRCEKMNRFLEYQITKIKKGTRDSIPNVIERFNSFVITTSDNLQLIYFLYLSKELADLVFSKEKEMISNKLETFLTSVGISSIHANLYPQDNSWILKVISVYIDRKKVVLNTLGLPESALLSLAPYITYFHLKKSQYSEEFIHQILINLENVKQIILDEEELRTFPLFSHQIKNLTSLELSNCQKFNDHLPKLPEKAKLYLYECNELDDKYMTEDLEYHLVDYFIPKNHILNMKDWITLMDVLEGNDEKCFLRAYRDYFANNGPSSFNATFSSCQMDLDATQTDAFQNLRKGNFEFEGEFPLEKDIQSLMARLLFTKEPVLKTYAFWSNLSKAVTIKYLKFIFPLLDSDQQKAFLQATTLKRWLVSMYQDENFTDYWYHNLNLKKENFKVYDDVKQHLQASLKAYQFIEEVCSRAIPQDSNVQYPFPELRFPYERGKSSKLLLIDLVVTQKKTIGRAMIIQLFECSNYPMIDFALTCVTDEYLKADANFILLQLAKLEDPCLFEIVSKRFPNYGSMCSFSLFRFTLQNGCDIFIEWVLHNGIEFDQNELEILQNLCAKTFRLRNMKAIEQYALRHQITLSVPSQSRLKIESLKGEKEIIKFMFNIALNSPLEDFYEIIIQYPFLEQFQSEVLQLVSLVVRFPHRDWYADMKKSNDLSSFNEGSFAYAQENLKVIEYLKSKITSFNRAEILDAIMTDRCARFEKHSPDFDYKKVGYNKKQIDFPNPMETPFLGRYFWSKRHLMSLINNKKNPLIKNLNLDWIGNEIQFFYFDENLKRYSLNRIEWYGYVDANRNNYTAHWYHTSADQIRDLQEHLEILHKDIVDFKLDSKNRKDFDSKVARCYWLMATLCETRRGTPHNVMIWLNLIYAHHQLPAPIPRLEHFFLDNTALNMPFDLFIEQWQSFFEPPFNPIS